jgi:hypothetical protein
MARGGRGQPVVHAAGQGCDQLAAQLGGELGIQARGACTVNGFLKGVDEKGEGIAAQEEGAGSIVKCVGD